MWDLILIAAAVVFFVIAVGYVKGCERLGAPAPPVSRSEAQAASR